MLARNWVVLLLSGLFIGTSLWILTTPYPSVFLMFNVDAPWRQGLAGGLAVLMAGVLAHLWPNRWSLYRGYVLPSLFGLWCFVTLVVEGIGWIPRSPYFPWWQGSVGWTISVLGLIGGLVYALPRLQEIGGAHQTTLRTPVSTWGPFAGVLVWAALAPLVLYHHRLTMLLLLFGVVVLTVSAELSGRTRQTALVAVIAAMVGSLLLLEWQGALLSYVIQSVLDGWLHCWREEIQTAIGGRSENVSLLYWSTGFIVSRLMEMGGWWAGFAVLVLTGVWLTLLWRIVGRQRDGGKRVLAESIVSVLTIRSLFAVWISTGIWPLAGMHFPFLSYGVRLMLLDGFLLGLLLVLDREREVPFVWRPATLTSLGIWFILTFCAGVFLGLS